MRVVLDERSRDAYGFSIELDTGGSPGEEVVVWVYRDNEPLLGKTEWPHPIQFRAYFATHKQARAYCNKFADDETFRQREFNSFFCG